MRSGVCWEEEHKQVIRVTISDRYEEEEEEATATGADGPAAGGRTLQQIKRWQLYFLLSVCVSVRQVLGFRVSLHRRRTVPPSGRHRPGRNENTPFAGGSGKYL